MTRRENPVPPTRAELRILNALWELKSGTIEEIIHYPSFLSPPNYKTTQTILRIMEEKGLARHTTGGRVFVFEPAARTRLMVLPCLRVARQGRWWNLRTLQPCYGALDFSKPWRSIQLRYRT